MGRLWWLQQHLSSCSSGDAKDSLQSQPRAWLSSLSYLYSQVAARLQNVLIKIKLKKKRRRWWRLSEDRGGVLKDRQTGQCCRMTEEG